MYRALRFTRYSLSCLLYYKHRRRIGKDKNVRRTKQNIHLIEGRGLCFCFCLFSPTILVVLLISTAKSAPEKFSLPKMPTQRVSIRLSAMGQIQSANSATRSRRYMGYMFRQHYNYRAEICSSLRNL